MGIGVSALEQNMIVPFSQNLVKLREFDNSFLGDLYHSINVFCIFSYWDPFDRKKSIEIFALKIPPLKKKILVF